MKKWINKIVVSPYETNCYFICSDNACLIIDPGDDFPIIKKHIQKNNLLPLGVIITHAHPDHIMGLKEVKLKYDPEVYIHPLESELLQVQSMAVEDNDILRLGPFELKIIHTPGHSPGSISILYNKKLFTGDTLFCGSVGRCDLPGGDEKNLKSSLKKILKLDKNITIYPGHGPECKLADEIKHNPFLQDII